MQGAGTTEGGPKAAFRVKQAHTSCDDSPEAYMESEKHNGMMMEECSSRRWSARRAGLLGTRDRRPSWSGWRAAVAPTVF
jgi:hypothetical protein